MNIPTQSRLIANIIQQRLSWSVIDSEGRPAHKPEGMDDLLCLLICHKIGTFKIVAGEPLPVILPKLNIRCEYKGDGIGASTYLNVIRVEQEDDASFTAVTDHWPKD